jgi:phage I-like protein
MVLPAVCSSVLPTRNRRFDCRCSTVFVAANAALADRATIAASAIASHATVVDSANVPEWVHLIPSGVIASRDGRRAPGGPWRLTDAAAVIETTNDYHSGEPIPIDFDHQLEHTEKNGAGAPASGWITALESRDDGIWGKVEWTPDGAEALGKRRYRYLSPVFAYNSQGEILALMRAGLTNKPNLPALTAINASTTTTTQEEEMSQTLQVVLQRLAALFGLPADADGDTVIVAANTTLESEKIHRTQISALRTKLKLANDANAEQIFVAAQATASVDPTKFVPIETYTAAASKLEQIQRTESARAVDAAIESGKIVPANRDWAIAYHSSNPEGFAQFVGKQTSIVKSGEETRERGTGAATSLTETEIAICAQTGVTEEQFLKTKNARKES